MSMILKGIDLPSDGEDVTIEINSSGYVRAYSTVPMVYDHDIQVIQIPKEHGSLIDRDEIYRAFSRCAENEADDGKIRVYAQLMRLILQAPTILESEENDERNT